MIGKSLNTMDISASLHFLSLFGLQVWGFKQFIDVKFDDSKSPENIVPTNDRSIRVEVVSPWHENGILGAVIIGQIFLHSPFCRIACISSSGQKKTIFT